MATVDGVRGGERDWLVVLPLLLLAASLLARQQLPADLHWLSHPLAGVGVALLWYVTARADGRGSAGLVVDHAILGVRDPRTDSRRGRADPVFAYDRDAATFGVKVRRGRRQLTIADALGPTRVVPRFTAAESAPPVAVIVRRDGGRWTPTDLTWDGTPEDAAQLVRRAESLLPAEQVRFASREWRLVAGVVAVSVVAPFVIWGVVRVSGGQLSGTAGWATSLSLCAVALGLFAAWVCVAHAGLVIEGDELILQGVGRHAERVPRRGSRFGTERHGPITWVTVAAAGGEPRRVPGAVRWERRSASRIRVERLDRDGGFVATDGWSNAQDFARLVDRAELLRPPSPRL